MSPDFFLEKTISRNHMDIFFSHFQSIRQAILELKFSKFFHIGSVTSAFERLIPSSFRRSKLLLTIWFLSQQKVVYETYLVPKQVKRYVNWRFIDLILNQIENQNVVKTTKNMLDIPIAHLARQITNYDRDILQKIDYWEYHNLAWQKANSSLKAPNLLFYIHNFNRVYYFESMI